MGGVDDRREQGKNGEEGCQEPIAFAFPPGFLFAPSDEEIVSYYLRGKNEGGAPTMEMEGLIVEYNIYGCNPWELPRHKFRYPGTQKDMYFFTPTGGGQGKRRSRTAGCGVWHGNGRDNLIRGGWDPSLAVVGHKTSFKFEMKSDEASSSSSSSKNKSRIKTDWLMQEYRLHPTGIGGRDADPIPWRFVLCRIYEKEKAANGDDDVDSLQLQPQLQAPQPKRKRPVSPADAADPFSPDTPLDMLSWEGVEDQGPSPKRRRVVLPEPDEEPEHQQEEALSDDVFAALSPLPLSAPDAQFLSAHQSGSPSVSSSSWDDLELDALLFPDGDGDALPSSPPLPSPAPPSSSSSDLASPPHQLDDLPCPPPPPSPSTADARPMTVVDAAPAPAQPGCPSSSSSDLASSLQQLDELLSRPPSPPPPSSSPLTAGLDPLQPRSEFAAADWRARFDPFYDASNFALHPF